MKSTIICLSLAALSATFTHAKTPILKDSFDYTSNSDFKSSDWTGGTADNKAFPYYATTDNGRNNVVILNNRFIYRDFGKTLTDSFSVNIDIQHNTSAPRQQWVLVCSEPDMNGKVEGYSFTWSSSDDRVFISRYSGDFSDYVASDRRGPGGKDLASALTGLNSLEANPMRVDQFETLTFAWDKSGALTLSAKSAGELLHTSDTSYSSFSRIYISGNANGYFDNLSVSTGR
ncbi:hypothetical protein [Coraliomargarita parva]|uniref:hypothetical protein n=1 Tax=Coraliomargarita parva TaxID=3014050 RepID=UPI0022B409A9|nr:hypothetical protein [Coraliomargarita parva]